VPVDGKKKASKLQLPKASRQEISSEEEEEEEVGTSEEDDPDYTEGDEGSDPEQDGRSDSEADVTEDEDDVKVLKERKQSASNAMVKTSAKQVKKEKKTPVKRKIRDDKDTPKSKKKRLSKEKEVKEKEEESEEKEEKTFSVDTNDESASKEEGLKKSGKKEMPTFSDKNVDYDLFHNSATNVIPRRIKISNNLVITSRMVEQVESKNITNDYPAITFQRKTAGEKCFEFILPLGLVPKIMEAMNIIVKDNGKFFANTNA